MLQYSSGCGPESTLTSAKLTLYFIVNTENQMKNESST